MEIVIVFIAVGMVIGVIALFQSVDKDRNVVTSTNNVSGSPSSVMSKPVSKPVISARPAPKVAPYQPATKTIDSAKSMTIHDYVKSGASDKKVLHMTYKKNNGETSVRDIEVLGYGPVYFDAYDLLRGSMRTFRTDRVLDINFNTSVGPQPREYSASSFVDSNMVGRSKLAK